MKVKLLFFASIREKIERDSMEINIQPNDSINIIYQKISKTYPQIKDVPDIKAACNENLISNWEHKLKDGDEIAFFPPITGG
ncbi:MAG: MoaD/ThiS family protein [Nitrosomonadales bacterium]|jgi:molybdopterin synthase sulfur carrier subunit